MTAKKKAEHKPEAVKAAEIQTQIDIEAAVAAANEDAAESTIDPEEVTGAEAQASGIVTKDKTPAGHTLFVGANKEVAISILANGVSHTPHFREGLPIWTIPNRDVEAFSAHVFVRHGKINKALGTK